MFSLEIIFDHYVTYVCEGGKQFFESVAMQKFLQLASQKDWVTFPSPNALDGE